MTSKSSTITDEIRNPTPGEMLLEDFMRPMELTAVRIAEDIGVEAARIDAIVEGRSAITADIDLRLARLFGLSDGFWLGVQADYDLLEQRRALRSDLARIRPIERAA